MITSLKIGNNKIQNIITPDLEHPEILDISKLTDGSTEKWWIKKFRMPYTGFVKFQCFHPSNDVTTCDKLWIQFGPTEIDSMHEQTQAVYEAFNSIKGQDAITTDLVLKDMYVRIGCLNGDVITNKSIILYKVKEF